MNSMFTERDPVIYKSLGSSAAQLFSITNMRNYEVYADEYTAIFIDAMSDLKRERIDLAH